MAKKSAKSRELKRGASKKKAGAGRKAAAPARGAKRKTAGARTAKGKAARKRAATPSRPAKRSAARQGRAIQGSSRNRTPIHHRPPRGPAGKSWKHGPRREAGSDAGSRQHAARFDQSDADETVDRHGSRHRAAPTPRPRTRAEAARSRRERPDAALQPRPGPRPLRRPIRPAEAPGLAAGPQRDQPGHDRRRRRCGLGRCVRSRRRSARGDNPTPDQDRVDDIGKALGVDYEDNEELKASDKITERDKHRWELDPASSEDYRDRD